VKSDGVEVVTAGATVAQFKEDVIVGEVGSGLRNVKIDADAGILIRNNTTTIASFGEDAIIGEVGSSKRNVKIDADAGILIRNNTTNLANFDTDITLGEVGTNKRNVFIDASAGVKIRNNTTDIASFGSDVTLTGGTFTINDGTRDRLIINSSDITMTDEAGNDQFNVDTGVVTIGSATDKVTIDGTSGITIRENNADTISLVNGVVTVGSSTDKVTINGTSGITIRENNKDNITLTDGTIKVGVDENNSTFIQIDSDSVDIIEDVSGTNNTVASFGVSTTIGSSTDKVSISASGITIRENNKDVITMASDVVTIGSSTDKVTINGTSGITIRENNKDNITLTDGTIKIGVDESNSTFVQIDSDSVDIIEDVSGTDSNVASFGVATRIGAIADDTSRVEIASGGVKIINRQGSTDTTMLNFKDDGDIESGDFLIERSRLFGAGNDGDVILKSNTAVVTNGEGSADEDGTESFLD